MTKQVQEVIFSKKTETVLYSSLSFNNIPLKNSMSQKHLGLTLDVKLNFVEHIQNTTQKLVKIWPYSIDFDQLYQYHYYWLYISRSPEVFLAKGILKICSKFTGAHPCRRAISIKLQNKIIKIALGHGCSTVNLLHISRNAINSKKKVIVKDAADQR